MLDIDNIKQEEIVIIQAEQELLEKLVWAEARGEDLDGQILIANVIFNRVKSDKFPNTIEEVINQKNQFSPVSNGALSRSISTEENKQAVELALDGKDNSQGALYFGRSQWHDTLTIVYQHGAHVFYI